MGDELPVEVVEHVVARDDQPVPCWSYVTHGLRAHGQDELVFTLVRGAGAPPSAPVTLLNTIARLARDGRTVGPGGFTELGPGGFLGNPALRGFGYQRAWPLEGVPLPPGALQLVALHGHEIDVARAHGVLRVLARIGLAYRFFPTAPWCDPTRAPIGSPPAGILANVPCARFDGVTATLDVAAGQVALRLARRGLPRLAAQLAELPANAAFALLTSLDPGADACLVWSPGQRAPEAIAAPGSTGAALAGCFALIVPQQADDGCELFEDGFAAMLTDVTTGRLRHALTHGHALALPSTKAGSHGLTVAWTE